MTACDILWTDFSVVYVGTAEPILGYGFRLLQGSALLVVGKCNDDDVQQECLLVPRKAFTNAYAQPFQKFFMTEPVDQGNEHQQVLIDALEWKSTE